MPLDRSDRPVCPGRTSRSDLSGLVGPVGPTGRTDPQSSLSFWDRSARPVRSPYFCPWISRTGRPDRSDPLFVHSLLFSLLPYTFSYIFMPHSIFLIFFRHSSSREDFGDILFAQIGRRMSPEQFAQVAGVFSEFGKIWVLLAYGIGLFCEVVGPSFGRICWEMMWNMYWVVGIYWRVR